MKKVIRTDDDVLALAVSKAGSGHGHGIDPRIVCALMGGADKDRITRRLHRLGWASCKPLPHGNCWHHRDERVASQELQGDVQKASKGRILMVMKGHVLADAGDPVTLLSDVLHDYQTQAATEAEAAVNE